MLMRAVFAAIVLPLEAVRVEQLQRQGGVAEEAVAEPWEGGLVPAEAGTRQQLLEALAPPVGKIYHFQCAEKFNFLDANEYDWVLSSVEEAGHRQTVNQTVVELRGSWRSSSFGHKRTRAKDMAGTSLFDIRMTSSVWNPLVAHWSWRIVVPEERGTDGRGDVLFTMNKDNIGGGALFQQEEWHVYRGHVSDNDKMYYCVGSSSSHTYQCYHTKRHVGVRPPAATANQLRNSATNMQDMWRDTYDVAISEGEDAALVLAIITAIDMTKDASPAVESDFEGHTAENNSAEEAADAEPQ